MKRLMLAVIMTVLYIGGVSAEEFVDKRFSRPIRNISPHDYPMLLSPRKIIFIGEDHILYEDCIMLENKKAYLKLKCSVMYQNDEDKNKYKDIENYVEFEILPPSLEDSEYDINMTTYSLYQNKPNDLRESSFFVKKK